MIMSRKEILKRFEDILITYVYNKHEMRVENKSSWLSRDPKDKMMDFLFFFDYELYECVSGKKPNEEGYLRETSFVQLLNGMCDKLDKELQWKVTNWGSEQLTDESKSRLKSAAEKFLVAIGLIPSRDFDVDEVLKTV